MKKKFLAVTMMVVVLGLSGCGSATADVNSTAEALEVSEEELVDDAETRMVECLEMAEYGDILDPTYEGQPLAPAFIMDDYLSGRQQYVDQYYTIEEDGWILATVYLGDSNIHSRHYYPGATCDLDWTAEELVESYHDHTLSWTRKKGTWRDYLYSDDYRTCFEVCDSWLWVDDIRVMPVEPITYGSMDPKDILFEYQHGIWDGVEPLFSYDYGMMVQIDDCDGTLEYHYEAVEYADEYDVMQVAHKYYEDPPAFMVTGSCEDFAMDASDVLSYEHEGIKSVREIDAEVETYVDLPNGTKDGLEDMLYMQYVGPDTGMYVVMPDRIELYRRGILLQTWECETDVAGYHYWRLYHYGTSGVFLDEIHVRVSDEKIVRLLPDSTVETVIDNLCGDIYGIGEYALLDLSLKDGKVAGYSLRCGLVDIADNISSIDYAWNIMLMTGKDGKCYAFDEADYMAMERQADAGETASNVIKVHCLGDESWEYYLSLYRAKLLEFPEDDA